jgi:hypothetical protein
MNSEVLSPTPVSRPSTSETLHQIIKDAIDTKASTEGLERILVRISKTRVSLLMR